MCSNLAELPSYDFEKATLGPWRSPVAHLHGMQGVRGSNPLGSTKGPRDHCDCGGFAFLGVARITLSRWVFPMVVLPNARPPMLIAQCEPGDGLRRA